MAKNLDQIMGKLPTNRRAEIEKRADKLATLNKSKMCTVSASQRFLPPLEVSR